VQCPFGNVYERPLPSRQRPLAEQY
jgi:hypothetical protein